MTTVVRERKYTDYFSDMAKARLRAMQDGPDRNTALEWLLIGMGISPECAVVDLDKMTVTVTLKAEVNLTV